MSWNEREHNAANVPIVVCYYPGAVIVAACSGDTILDAALENGIPIEHECGGNCACTTCHVLVNVITTTFTEADGSVSELEDVEKDRLSGLQDSELKSNSRLACQAILLKGRVEVTVVGSEPN